MCLLDLIDRLVFFLFEKYIFIISIIRFGNIFVIFISMWIGENKGYIYILNFCIWILYLINIFISYFFFKVYFNYWYNIKFRFFIVMLLYKRLKGKIFL